MTVPLEERPLILPSGPNADAFREGWLLGKAHALMPIRCPFPRGSIGRAAFCAAKAYHKELKA